MADVIQAGSRSSPDVHAAAEAPDDTPGAAGQVRYVVVCRGPNCRERGGRELRQRLVQLVRGAPSTRLIGYACFGQCERGPNVAFYPDGEWYGGLHGDDAAERVVGHATGERPLDGAPLELPPAEREQHLRNIAELVGTVERDAARPRRWWWWPF